MPDGKITANDLISPDVKQALTEINNELLKLLGTIENVAKGSVSLRSSFSQTAQSQDQTAKSAKSTADNLNVLQQAEKELQKIEAQKIKIEAQIIAQQSQQFKEMTAAKNTRQQQAKDIQTQVKLEQALSKELGNTTKNLGEMRKELQLLKNTSFAGKTSDEINAIQKRIGELTKAMKDERAMVSGMGEDFAVVAGKSLKLFVAGIEGVIGSMNALGIESETLEPLQKNIVSLIAISQALAEVQDALEQRTIQVTIAKAKDALTTAYDTVVKWLNTSASIANTKAEEARAVMSGKAGIATKLAAAAQWLWNAAIAANPIGLLIAGVVTLVGGIYLLTKAFSGEADVAKKLNKDLKEMYDQKKNIQTIDEYLSKRAEIQGQTEVEKINAQIDANDDLQNQLEDEIDILERLFYMHKADEEQTKRLKEAKEELQKANLEGKNLELQLDKVSKAEQEKSALAFMQEKVLISKKGTMQELTNQRAYLSYEHDLYLKNTKDTAGEQAKVKAEYLNKLHDIDLKEQELIKKDTLSRLEAKVLQEKETDIKIFNDREELLKSQWKWELKQEGLTAGEKIKINASYEKQLKQLAQERQDFINQNIIAEQEAKVLATKEGSIEELAAQKELLAVKFNIEVSNEKLTQEQKDKIRAQYNRDLISNSQQVAAKQLSFFELETTQETTALTNQYLKREINAKQLADGMIDIQIKQAEKELEIANLTIEQKAQLEEKLANLKKQKMEEDKASQQEYFNAAKDLADSLFSYRAQQYDNELQILENQKNAKIAAAGDDAKAKERIDKEFAAKEAAVKRKQAQADKQQALFNAAINIAQGVTKALASAPPPANMILAAITAAAGAVQMAAIISKPIPKFAKGIRGFEGGLAEVGEAGRELIRTPQGNVFLTPDTATRMVLPKGTDVFTHSETERMLREGITTDKFDSLISEQRKTRQALSNKVEKNWNLTPGGWIYTTRKSNAHITHIDKYFRT